MPLSNINHVNMNAYTSHPFILVIMLYDFIYMHYRNIMWPTINEPSRRRF
jgi:hypothetical protein